MRCPYCSSEDSQVKDSRPAEDGAAIRIIYGGSVNPENAAEIIAGDEVNGALVGGASLSAESFMNIVLAAQDVVASQS